MTTNQYFFGAGLSKLAKSLKGDEHIHAGMRPYGFHIGNKLPLIVYPILLGNEMRKRGIEPRFRYSISLNDWDTDSYLPINNYPMNLVPKGYSFQYQKDTHGCHNSRVDHWESVIEDEIKILREKMPNVRCDIIRVSSLKRNDSFLRVMRFGLDYPEKILAIIKENMKIDVLSTPTQFIGSVCKSCFSIEGLTSYSKENDEVCFICSKCRNKQETFVWEQDYWIYVHLLGAAKNAALRPDIWIFGGDFITSDSIIFHKAVYEASLGYPLRQKHLFTTVLLGPDGQKMSKSIGNLADIPLNELIKKVDGWNHFELGIYSHN